VGGAGLNNQRLSKVEAYNPALDPITTIENDEILLDKFKLEQNYPNPFNPTTTIKYSIPELSFVTIKIFNVLGSEVAALANEEKPAGSYNVQFIIKNLQLSSGVYFYRLEAGGFVEIKKMMILK
jgi:hypothetical protein